MKFKSLIYCGVAALGLMATACTDDDPKYNPADAQEMPEVYFSYANDGTAYEIGDTDSEFVMPVYRKSSEGAATYQVELSGTDASLFSAPASVSFADGEDEALITVTYDAAALTPAVEYTVTLTLPGVEDSPYFLGSTSVTVMLVPWKDVVGPNGEQYAKFTDNVLVVMWGVDPFTYDVKLQSCDILPGVYRVVNAYTSAHPAGNPDAALGTSFSYDQSKDYYMYFNVSDPDNVFMCTDKGEPTTSTGKAFVVNTGACWDEDGFFYLIGAYNNKYASTEGDANAKAKAAAEYAGTFKDGVLQFKGVKAMIYSFEKVFPNVGSSREAPIKIVWPGVVEAPEEPEVPTWESIGTAQYTDPLIFPLFGYEDPQTWEVEVEKNTEEPGLFRLVNPYKSGVMIVEGQDVGFPYDGDLYIEFDCSNEDCVLIPSQNTGFEDEEDGVIYMANAAYAYSTRYPIEAIIEAGLGDVYDASTYTVTIAAGHAWLKYPNSVDPESYYSPNVQIDGKIVMSDQAAAQAKLSVASARNYTKKFGQLLKQNGLRSANGAKRLTARGAKAHVASGFKAF